MLSGFPRPVDFVLCAIVVLCGAQVRIEDCRFDRGHLVCTYPAATYHIRIPEERAPGTKAPVVVILHDAGRSGAEVLENEPLIRAFHDAGYAVIAPEGLPRKNRKIKYNYVGGSRPLLAGDLKGTLPVEFSLRKFLVETPAGETRVLQFGIDRGWYFYSIDRANYVDRSVRVVDEIQNMIISAATR